MKQLVVLLLAVVWPRLVLGQSTLDTARLSTSFEGLQYYDASTLTAGFALEVASFSDGTAATDDIVVSSVTKAGTLTTITSTLPLTAAQILQQFLSTDASRTMSPFLFPIFSTTTQVLVTVVGNSTAPSASYDFTCDNGANCYGVGSCFNGLCGCIPDADDVCLSGTIPNLMQPHSQCVSGASLPTPYADVCASTLSTVDELVYTAGSCESHGAGMVNLYPRRRFCQRRDYANSMDRTVFTGLLGNPYDYGNSTGGLRLFTISSPLTMDELLHQQNQTVAVTQAYVSNLYDNAAPVTSKVWAQVEFDTTMYSANSVQLTRLVFLDAIEGDRRYYFQGDRWLAYPNNTLPAGAYAYWDATLGQVGWECQLQYIYNPSSGACEPGCNNGLVGPDCSVAFSNTSIPCAVRSFNPNTTLYVSYGCDDAVCLPGYFLGAFGCVPNLAVPVFVITNASSSSSSVSSIDVIVIVFASLAGVLVLGSVYSLVQQVRIRKKSRLAARANAEKRKMVIAAVTRGRAHARAMANGKAKRSSSAGPSFSSLI